MNANLHAHTLAMDGVFVDEGEERELVFLEQFAPSQEEVEAILRAVVRRVSALLAARGDGEQEAPLRRAGPTSGRGPQINGRRTPLSG